MLPRIIIFNVIQLFACLYAISRGGAPERAVAWMMAGAAGSTAMLAHALDIRFYGFSAPIFAVDTALLLALIALAVRANRFWPMWVAALQLLSLGIHTTVAIYPTILPSVYNRTAGAIAYPMIVLLIIGTARHYRRRAHTDEQDWSPLIW